jgi:hypothetical protein
VTVKDVEAAARDAKSLGARILQDRIGAARAGDLGGNLSVPPADIPNVGRFSFVRLTHPM